MLVSFKLVYLLILAFIASGMDAYLLSHQFFQEFM